MDKVRGATRVARVAEPEEHAQKADDPSAEGDPPDRARDEEAEARRADRVAEALGVGADDGEQAAEAPAEEEAKPAVKNRAARRKEEAVGRRRKRRGEATDGADDELPRDRNARAKELLKRRQEDASIGRRDIALAPSEMVDDALARMGAASGKWFRDNFHILQWVFAAVLVAGAGYLVYASQMEEKAGAASDTLADAVAADRGRVLEEDKRSDEEKAVDISRVFKTADERADAALAAYVKVAGEHPGTGAAILAKLGEAGAHLDKREFKEALAVYADVRASKLAAADLDVKGRAIEGAGFAKEGMNDLDGALVTFKELEGVDARGYKELALYHQARILLLKGDKAKAKELLQQAREKLQAPSTEGKSFQFLEAVVDESLRSIDPTAVPARTQLGGPKGSTITPEELERLLKKAREAGEKAPDSHE
jgi:hypothetical protein